VQMIETYSRQRRVGGSEGGFSLTAQLDSGKEITQSCSPPSPVSASQSLPSFHEDCAVESF
jgi:hypothetical protein